MQFERRVVRKRPLISLTPLIDVVFILLLFFMLASNFSQWHTIDVITPSAGSTQSDAGEPLIIQIDRAGNLRFDGILTDPDDLNGAAGAGIRRQPQRRIIVQPAADVSLQTIVSILERLQAAGGRRIALQRQRAQAENP
jgi:biopolymer transport protein ExbD